MSGSDAGGPRGAPLTAAERRRLRAGVDPAALDAFLARTPAWARTMVVFTYYAALTPDDAARFAWELCPGSLLPPPGADAAAAGDYARIGVTMTLGEVIELYVAPLHAPADPSLHGLWSAIEPGGPRRPRPL